MMNKILLGSYPYTYARICAMKSLLVKKEDYDKLLKMKVNEIAKFLQETQYKKEIDEIAISIEGIDKIELALNRNLANEMLKVKRISTGNLRLLIDFYLKRYDIMNLNTILRGKFAGYDAKKIEEMLIPVGDLNIQYLKNLIRKESVEDIAKSIPFIDLKEAVGYFKQNNDLFELENDLDKYYYSQILSFSERIAEQGKLFREFLKHEIDILNIKTILRLKKQGTKKSVIEKFVFYSGQNLSKTTLNKMIDCTDVKDIIKIIKSNGYRKVIESAKDENSLIHVELALNHYLLDKAMLLFHQNPLSIDVLLGYMFAKEIEVRNLKILTKGKQLGVAQDLIEKELIVRRR